jgi:hypothetical protein
MASNCELRITGCGFRIRLRCLIFLLLPLFLVIHPASPELRAEEKPGLAIFPFYILRVEDPARGAFCPVCKEVHRSSAILPDVPKTLTRELYGKMEALGPFRVLPLDKMEETLSPGGNQKRFEASPVSTSVQLGRELNVDFVMVCILFRFEERVGSSLGVEKPASVAFDLHLYRVRDGQKVWDGDFDETQKALFDNLLQAGSFFRQGAKWLTAEQLAEGGMDGVLKKLPGAKELEGKP